MSDLHASPVAPLIPRRRVLVSLLSAAGVMALPSCGGGGGGDGVAGVDTGGTGSFSVGSIVGFGSVIVNGVRFEDNAARVADDDGGVLTANDLRLGMVVRVQGGTITAGSGDVLPSATATSIVVESQIKGPVESKTGTDTLVVFGQTVKVNAATVFDGVTFAAIAVGDILEVSGFADAAGVITASRIEREGAGTNEFKVRGVIANLNTTNSTFQIGSATFNFAGLGATTLANGQFVRVRTTTTRNASGQWVVTRIDLRAAVEDRNEAEIEGILVQNGAVLQVNGITINTSRLAAGSVPAAGQKVEVEGQLVNGVLIANRIKIEDANEGALVDVRGTASAVDKIAQTFVVRGVTFHYTPGTTDFRNGTVDTLVNGANVRVRGTLPTGGAGAVQATRIDFQP
jgi:hypothetical protein